jgi:hypothetical protein
MLGARQSVTANTMQPMAPQNPDAATLMQMGGAP